MTQTVVNLPDGGVLVWTLRGESVDGRFPTRSFFGAFGADGSVRASDVAIGFPDPAGAPTDQVVIRLAHPLPDGGVRFYLFQRPDGEVSGQDFIRDYALDGTPLGDAVPIRLGVDIGAAIALPDGRLAVPNFARLLLVDFVEFTATRGGATQIRLTLPAHPDQQPNIQSIHPLADGRLLVLSNIPDAARASTDLSVVAHVVDPVAGAVVGDPFTVLDGAFARGTTVGLDRNSLAVTELSDGRIVVVASRRDVEATDFRQAAFVTVLEADGRVAIPPFLADPDSTRNELNVGVTALPDGGFVVSYLRGSVNGQTYTGTAVARLFSGDGQEIAVIESGNPVVGILPFVVQPDGDVVRLNTTTFEVVGTLEAPTGLRPADDEFRISSGNMGSVIDSPDAVMLPDGDILFAATGGGVTSGSGAAFGVTLHRTAAAGGEPQLVYSLAASDLGFTRLNRLISDSDVAVRPDGSHAVAMMAFESFVDSGGTQTEYAIFVQHFSAAGTPVGAPIEIERWPAGSSAAVLQNLRLEAYGDGYLLTGGVRLSGTFGIDDSTQVRKIAVNGGQEGPSLRLEGTAAPDMLALPEGRMLLAWVEGGLRTALVGPDGALVAPVASLEAAAMTGGFQHSGANQVALRQLSDGRIVALYEGRADGADPAGLYLLQLDATGQAVGSRSLAVPATLDGGALSPSASDMTSRFDLAEFPDGQLVVAFTFDPAGTDTRDVGMIVLSAEGEPRSSTPIVLTENTLREQYDPAFLIRPDGTVVLTFYDDRPPALGGRSEMRAVALIGPDPAPEPEPGPPLVVAPDTAQALEDGPAIGGSVLANDSGVGLAVISVNGSGAGVGAALTGSFGTLTLQADGTYAYLADAATRLPAGATGTDTFTYRVRDAAGAEAEATLTITVTGANDPAAIDGPRTGRVVEDDLALQSAAGTLTVTDPDTGEARFAPPAAGSLQGTYGRFAFDPESGAWSYRLARDSAAVRALDADEQVEDTLRVVSRDGTAEVTITIDVIGSGVRAPVPTVEVSGRVLDRAGTGMADTTVTFEPELAPFRDTLTGAGGVFAIGIEAGQAGRLEASRAYGGSDPAMTAESALEALRIAIGLTPTWGPAEALDFIAADFNGDGVVDSTDALGILRVAVGLTDASAPRWLFLDAEADLSGITREATRIESGIALDPLTADLGGRELVGILVGNVQDFG